MANGTSTMTSTTTSTTLSTSTTTTLGSFVDFDVDVRARVNTSDQVVELELSRGDQSAVMTAYRTWTLEQLAREILHQHFGVVPDKVFQRRVHIEAHQMGVVPAVFEWVIDDVSAAQLPDEAAADGFEGLPGWSSWTADQAADWIDVNVADLASAKVALTAMARAIVLLRDWRR